MDSWRAALGELAEKYRSLLTLCGEREALEASGVLQLEGEARSARHGRSRALAERFPGALRELDGATTTGLAARLQAIEEELASGRPRQAAPRWMRIVDEFHTDLRGRLHIKGARSRGESLTRSEQEMIADPPYGRLQELVWNGLAQRHGLTVGELKAIVHGGSE